MVLNLTFKVADWGVTIKCIGIVEVSAHVFLLMFINV